MAPKKKLTKKEKARLEAERAEAQRIELEKERQRQLEEEKERKRLERVEAERRQKQEIQENKIRRVQLKRSCEHFNQIHEEIESIYAEVRKQKEWKRYMRCNGLPNAYDPGDLRKYIHMWLLHIDKYNQEERNWLLLTNERTVLTQNQTILDMTRINLKKQQVNLGDLYSKRIKEVLGILNEIEEAILDMYSLSKSVIKDLHKIKYNFRSILSDYIDEFTFKILSNIDRDMELDKGLIAKHQYISDVFKSQIWTLREIPQPQLNPKEKLKAERSHTEIEFPLIDLSITLPPSIKCKDSAVRALWLNYDHVSDYCSSFYIPLKPDTDTDIGKVTRIEWKKRKEILKTALEESANETSAPQGSNINEAQDSGIIDVNKMFNDYEDEQYKVRRKQKGPEGLNLKDFDVNLRSHRIVAGIYCVEYLEQPQQDIKLNNKSYLRTLVYPNKLKRKPFHQTYKPPAPVLPGVRRLPEEIEAEMREVEANLDKLGSATIKLPEDVMWFEPPIVCRWETAEETKISEQKDKKRLKSTKLSRPKKQMHPPKVIEDFNLLNIPPGLDLYCIMQEFVMPRLPNGYSVKIEKIESERRRSSLLRRRKDSKEDTPDVSARPTSVNIKNALNVTNSPRPLFPKIIIKRELTVVEKLERANSIESTESSTISETEQNALNNANRRVYMFSKLLRDLDELSELQSPYIDKIIDELSESMSMSVEEEEETEAEQDLTAISFLRASDYTWNFNKKEEVEEPIAEPEESDDSSMENEDEDIEESDHDEDESEIPVGKWSTRDIHDPKFNEEKLAIQFKLGRLGAYGLAVNWYSNLPFQTWELKPDIKTTDFVIFSLSASVMSIEITILCDGIILNSFQGGVSNILQDIIGKTMSFQEFRNILTGCAINLFPEDDAFCYAEGTCEKHAVMESHLYTCMGSIALTHNFTWSRWNLLSGRRSCVLLMREIVENRKIPNHSTLQVTPLKACVVDCTDVSTSFNPVGIEGMEFYADLHHLAQNHSQPASLLKHANMNPMLRDNIIQVLKATRPLSFC